MKLRLTNGEYIDADSLLVTDTTGNRIIIEELYNRRWFKWILDTF
ncbi:hypothetical protein [uncultured Desulfobacter sp.]|nr:hypothetical protein [uncultured Desulfobacter sp.]